MPVYEYTCQACQRDFELLVKGPSTEIACPQCHSQELKKRISSFNSSTSSNQPEMAPGGCGRCGSSTPGMCNL